MVKKSGLMSAQGSINAMTSEVVVGWLFDFFWSEIPQRNLDGTSSTQLLSICVWGGWCCGI